MVVNQQTLMGDWNRIKGKLRERWGDLSGDELESVHGDVDQLVGTIQRQTGEARESVEGYLEELTSNGASMAASALESVRRYAHSAHESVAGPSDQATQAVKAGYERTEAVVQNRPIQSLVACFSMGLITGILVGLTLRSR